MCALQSSAVHRMCNTPGSSWLEQVTVLLQKAPAPPCARSCLTKSSRQQQGNISLSSVTYSDFQLYHSVVHVCLLRTLPVCCRFLPTLSWHCPGFEELYVMSFKFPYIPRHAIIEMIACHACNVFWQNMKGRYQVPRERKLSDMKCDCRANVYFKTLCFFFSFIFKVVINGGATSSGDQDTEDTELMAIYTTENGIAEKVCGGFLLGGNSFLLFHFYYLSTLILLGWEIFFL